MPGLSEFILGEHVRKLDDRFRLSIPVELAEAVAEGPEGVCVLVKERPGCLSLWDAATWQVKLDQSVALVKAKMQAGKLEGRLGEVQGLGRLLSTRHRTVQLAARARLSVPEGFREFLNVEIGGDVVVVGAAVCVEVWHPKLWLEYLNQRIGKFSRLIDRLSG